MGKIFTFLLLPHIGNPMVAYNKVAVITLVYAYGLDQLGSMDNGIGGPNLTEAAMGHKLKFRKSSEKARYHTFPEIVYETLPFNPQGPQYSH